MRNSIKIIEKRIGSSLDQGGVWNQKRERDRIRENKKNDIESGTGIRIENGWAPTARGQRPGCGEAPPRSRNKLAHLRPHAL
ncbi:hypothetical protein EVAR_90780_1 [Eumeta japonica]|uniref:Uncharacterized protein n=1 Tax=Eumeta variegata TaxID=151549 RepID=A0A4C1YIL2_EUMVA|nr:hypothetical protein EVAR_90780_1 [Eumeta japonica]